MLRRRCLVGHRRKLQRHRQPPPLKVVECAGMSGEARGIDLDDGRLAVEYEELEIRGNGSAAIIHELLDEDARRDVPVGPFARYGVVTLSQPLPAEVRQGLSIYGAGDHP